MKITKIIIKLVFTFFACSTLYIHAMEQPAGEYATHFLPEGMTAGEYHNLPETIIVQIADGQISIPREIYIHCAMLCGLASDLSGQPTDIEDLPTIEITQQAVEWIIQNLSLKLNNQSANIQQHMVQLSLPELCALAYAIDFLDVQPLHNEVIRALAQQLSTPAARQQAAQYLNQILQNEVLAEFLAQQPVYSWLLSQCHIPEAQTLTGHTNCIRSVCFSPDRRILASTSVDNTVRLWDVQYGTCMHILTGHTLEATSVCFSPDGRTVASASDDHTVRLWDIHDGTCIYTLTGHTFWVNSVCFSPDGRRLASASWDHTVRLWNVQDRSCMHTLNGHTNSVVSVCFSPDGRTLASASTDRTVRLWNVQDGICTHTLTGHTGWINSVCFSPDGRTLASASDAVRLWNVENETCIHTLTGHTDFLNSVCFSPNGRMLASTSMDDTVRLWDVQNGTCIHTLTGHTGPVWSVCFSPDGRTLASASWDHTVRLWNVHELCMIKQECERLTLPQVDLLIQIYENNQQNHQQLDIQNNLPLLEIFNSFEDNAPYIKAILERSGADIIPRTWAIELSR